ncbi:MAG: lipoate--protein ligase family protein [candidate division Zixibacteria bacterium]|nr:lipoate--protein ligase family protein [candidate division Zixibacteria bacterium]
MATDEMLFEEVKERKRPPTLRFYRWAGDWVSYGYFQTPQKALNLEAAEELGVQYVRRQTGGRAVVHSEDLTYSLVAGDAQRQGLGSSLKETYRQIARALTSGFMRLGLPVDSFPGANETGRQRQDGPAPCFLTLSDHEISVGGKKLVGSAQFRQGQAFLQHGSVPLSVYNRKLAQQVLTKMKGNGGAGSDYAPDFGSRYAVLEEAAGRKIPVKKLTDALRDGFERTFGVTFEPEEFSSGQKQIIERRAEKYASEDWKERKRTVAAAV